MTMTVWKHTIPIQTDPTNVETRAGARFVHADVVPNGYEINVWAIVDTDTHVENRTLIVRATGEPIPTDAETDGQPPAHIASVVDRDTSQWMPLVWHVFEIGVFS